MTRVAVFAMLATAAACGYQLLHGNRPFGLSRIAVPPFSEEVPLGLSPDLTQAVAERIGGSGIMLVSDPSAAEATLDGRVLASSTVLSPTSGVGARIPAYAIGVQIEVRLVTSAGRELWRTQISVDESFLPASTPSDTALLETEANRRRALLRLAHEAAREIHEQLSLAGLPSKVD